MTDSEKLDLLLADMSGLKEDVSGLKEDVSGLKEDVSSLNCDMSAVKQDVKQLKYKVSRVELILENEIRESIQRVAEGHLDLSRNLHEAMKPSNEVEVLSLKVKRLESDVDRLKDKIS